MEPKKCWCSLSGARRTWWSMVVAAALIVVKVHFDIYIDSNDLNDKRKMINKALSLNMKHFSTRFTFITPSSAPSVQLSMSIDTIVTRFPRSTALLGSGEHTVHTSFLFCHQRFPAATTTKL